METKSEGLFNYSDLLDTLTTDCNNLVRNMAEGQYIQFCNRIVSMAQKIQELKTGMKNDLDSKDRQIEELKKLNNEMASKITGLPVNDGPAVTEDEL